MLLEPPTYRARGTANHSTVRPRWTLAELGQAAQNIPKVPFMAACYSYAGDHSNYWPLQAALLSRARHLSHQRHWPHDVGDVHGIRQPYLAHLAILVLDADSGAARFNAFPGLYAAWMRVSQRTWERDLEERFWLLHDVWIEWLGQAVRMMQGRLRAE